MNNDTSSLKKPLTKGQILAYSIAALLTLAWLAFRDVSKQSASSIEAPPIESNSETVSNFSINDAKYLVGETRKLYNEGQQLMADETWVPPANAFEANPVNLETESQRCPDEVFSLYGYQPGARSDGTVRQLVVDGLQRLTQSMLHYEAFAADHAGASKSTARESMVSEMVACKSTLEKAAQAIEAGKL